MGSPPISALNARGIKKLQFPSNVILAIPETIEVRWVYGAWRFTSIGSSFGISMYSDVQNTPKKYFENTK